MQANLPICSRFCQSLHSYFKSGVAPVVLFDRIVAETCNEVCIKGCPGQAFLFTPHIALSWCELERFFTLAAGSGSRAMFSLSPRLKTCLICIQWSIHQSVSVAEPIVTGDYMLHGVPHALPHSWHK